MIVIDTDVLIEIMDKRSAKGEEAFRRILESGESFAITSITLHEILYGLYKYAKPVEEVLRLPVLGYGREDAELSAKLELEAEKMGYAISRMDAMVAAIAINNNAKLYTFNQKHFKPLESLGLKLFE